jgi:gliding motility-associated-like protein
MLSQLYKTLRIICFVMLWLLVSPEVKATHIIGGDMTYKQLGNNRYQITLTLRRDCALGQVDYDNPASVGIFSASSNTLIREVLVPFVKSDTVSNTIASACGFQGSPVCVETTTYQTEVELPFLAGGYIIAYQRCCRNGSLNNVVNPLESGSTEWVEITERALTTTNSSPAFVRWPDVYICANQPLVFDHAAIDPDGDSLVYKICTPSEGGTFQFPRPQPPTAPPYLSVQWASPYSLDNLLGGTPLKIDAKTGLITAVPNLVGQYLVGICVEEYRNGVLISTVRRDFQYNVRVCNPGLVVDFEAKVKSPCDSLTLAFTNKTKEGGLFFWNFNYPSTDAKYLKQGENPDFKFDVPGVYKVQLIAVSNTGACQDSITKEVVVRPGGEKPALNLAGAETNLCAGSTANLLISPDAINKYVWSPTTGLDLSDPANPKFAGTQSATYNVTVTNPNGCINSGSIKINVSPATTPISITGNTNVCDTVLLTASGGNGAFEWSTSRNFANVISNAAQLKRYQPEAVVKYYVRSVNALCGNVMDSVTVRNQSLNIEYANIATICKGSTVDLIFNNKNTDHQISIQFNDPHIVAINNNVVTVKTLADDKGSVVLRGSVTNQFNCRQDVAVTLNVIDQQSVSFDATLKSCDDLTMCFKVTGNYTGNLLWNFGSSQPVNTSTDAAPCFKYNAPGPYTVTLSNSDALCKFETISKTITVPRLGDKKVSVSHNAKNCDNNEVCFAINGTYYGDITWNFGDPKSGATNNSSNLASPCHKFSGQGTYVVTLTNQNPLCPFENVSYSITIGPKFALNPLADQIICQGQTVNLSASSNDPSATYAWYDTAGKLLGTNKTLSLTPTNDTEVLLKGLSQMGCSDSLRVKLSVFKFDYTLEFPKVICPKSEYQVKINITNPEKYTFLWTPVSLVVNGANTAQPILLADYGKKVTVEITNKETGCKEIKEIVPDIKAPFVYNFTGAVCNNQPSTVNINITNPNDYTYVWSPANLIVSGGNTASPVIKVTSGQQLKVIVTNKATGCSEELTYTPQILPPLSVSFTEPNLSINQGKSVDIEVKNPLSGATYTWNTGAKGTSIKVNPIQTTTYTVTVTDAGGCTGTGQITVTVRVVSCTDKDEYLPNAFTPNGDGKNDILYVKSNVITEMTLVIYNRWGQEVFSTNQINEGWDGTFEGKNMAPDAYAYYLKATCISGDKFVKKGNVSLLR